MTSWRQRCAPIAFCLLEFAGLLAIFFVYAGDAPPGVNEAHYLVKAKNFWQPAWCQNDLFASSGKAHLMFYVVFGWPTRFLSLAATAWIGRFVGWSIIAIGIMRLRMALKMPAVASCVVAVCWLAGLDYGNLAGEWVIGGIEGKVPAYGLVLCGVAALVQNRWSSAWIWFGTASAFHVLTGGWSVVAGVIAFTIMRCLPRPPKEGDPRLPSFWSMGLLVGGAISLLGVVPAAAMSFGVSAEDSAIAAETYTYFRISHHLLPTAFHSGWYLRHGVLTVLTLLAAVWLARNSNPTERGQLRVLFSFTIGAMCISMIGLLLAFLPSFAPELGAKLLRYYWFRLADAITPLTFACIIAKGLSQTPNHARQKTLRIASMTICVIACGLTAHSTWLRMRTGVPVSVSNRLIGLDADANYFEQRQVMRDWLDVCRFIRASTPSDEVLLTPRHQQSFKWYAHRAEVVNWKDIPQDAESLKEWRKRFYEVYPTHLSTMRVTISYAGLRKLRRKYNTRWMIVDRRVVGPQLPLVQVYPRQPSTNRTYAVYRLPEIKNANPADH